MHCLFSLLFIIHFRFLFPSYPSPWSVMRNRTDQGPSLSLSVWWRAVEKAELGGGRMKKVAPGAPVYLSTGALSFDTSKQGPTGFGASYSKWPAHQSFDPKDPWLCARAVAAFFVSKKQIFKIEITLSRSLQARTLGIGCVRFITFLSHRDRKGDIAGD